MRKLSKAFVVSTVALSITGLFSLQNVVNATESLPSQQLNELVTAATTPPVITGHFTDTMRNNGAYMLLYAFDDSQQGTYPAGTAFEFTDHVRPGGDWDYKLTLGTTTQYTYDGVTTTGEDLGNIHYGYVGRMCGFSETLLKSAAGAAQIYAGTEQVKWYSTYFDDPTDQAAIKRGFGYYTNGLPGYTTTSSSFIVSPEAKLIAESMFTSEERAEIKKRAEINSQKIKNGEELTFE